MLMDQYADALQSVICQIRDTQREKILQAAQIVSKTICEDGLIYVFGCGHSHLEPLMLHESASRSGFLEKQTGLAEEILAPYAFTSQDVLFVASTSGVNGVPVEVAAEAKRRGVTVLGIASDAYLDIPPRNKHNAHLQQVCDLYIDNAVPQGDACLQPRGLDIKMTPVSTVAGAYILHSILAEATQLALDAGCKVPVYLSGNVPGGNQYNEQTIARYKSRIACL